MPPRGISQKRKRQYQHIKESERDAGRSNDVAEEIAARTVNKQRAQSGEARETSRGRKRAPLATERRGAPSTRKTAGRKKSARKSAGRTASDRKAASKKSSGAGASNRKGAGRKTSTRKTTASSRGRKTAGRKK